LRLELPMMREGAARGPLADRRANPAGANATRSRLSAVSKTKISVQLDGGIVSAMAGLHICART